MDFKKAILIGLGAIIFCASNGICVGQSTMISLKFPSGARSAAMGEVGTALADDEEAVFFNPAGLGFINQRWQGGAGTGSFEQLLPAFDRDDLWHLHGAAIVQDAPHQNRESWGGFGLDFNMINSDLVYVSPYFGRALQQNIVNEQVWTVSYGSALDVFGFDQHAVGFSASYYYATCKTLAGTPEEGIRGLAFDFGYLWRIAPPIQFGLTFLNMGADVYNPTYEPSNPLPFMINIAMAYQDTVIRYVRGPILTLAGEVRLEREFVKNYADRKPDPFYTAIVTSVQHQNFKEFVNSINYHYGIEATMFNIGSIRFGFLNDAEGTRYELHYGMGVKLFNHFQIDWSAIYSPEGAFRMADNSEGATGARHGQLAVTVTMFRIFNWRKSDWNWFFYDDNTAP